MKKQAALKELALLEARIQAGIRGIKAIDADEIQSIKAKEMVQNAQDGFEQWLKEAELTLKTIAALRKLIEEDNCTIKAVEKKLAWLSGLDSSYPKLNPKLIETMRTKKNHYYAVERIQHLYDKLVWECAETFFRLSGAKSFDGDPEHWQACNHNLEHLNSAALKDILRLYAIKKDNVPRMVMRPSFFGLETVSHCFFMHMCNAFKRNLCVRTKITALVKEEKYTQSYSRETTSKNQLKIFLKVLLHREVQRPRPDCASKLEHIEALQKIFEEFSKLNTQLKTLRIDGKDNFKELAVKLIADAHKLTLSDVTRKVQLELDALAIEKEGKGMVSSFIGSSTTLIKTSTRSAELSNVLSSLENDAKAILDEMLRAEEDFIRTQRKIEKLRSQGVYLGSMKQFAEYIGKDFERGLTCSTSNTSNSLFGKRRSNPSGAVGTRAKGIEERLLACLKAQVELFLTTITGEAGDAEKIKKAEKALIEAFVKVSFIHNAVQFAQSKCNATVFSSKIEGQCENLLKTLAGKNELSQLDTSNGEDEEEIESKETQESLGNEACLDLEKAMVAIQEMLIDIKKFDKSKGIGYLSEFEKAVCSFNRGERPFAAELNRAFMKLPGEQRRLFVQAWKNLPLQYSLPKVEGANKTGASMPLNTMGGQ